MEAMSLKMLASLYVYGPLGILAVLGFVLFFIERRRSNDLTDKIRELSIASIQADMSHTKTYESLEKVLDHMMRVVGGRGL